MKKRKSSEIHMGFMHAIVGVLIMVVLVNYAGFIVTARMHLESDVTRNDALQQMETLSFNHTLKGK